MRHLYSDIKRILILTENLLYLAGKSLQRRAMRNGVLISVAFSSTIIRTNQLAAEKLSNEQLTTLLLVAFASYPAGTLLVRIANLLTRDNLDAAAGGHLYLTSHFKKSRMRIHLNYLWYEVFRFEPRDAPMMLQRDVRDYNYNSAVKERGRGRWSEQTPGEVDSEVAGCLFPTCIADSEQEQSDLRRFTETGLYALASPLPMGVQSARIGIHLGPIEDWYEKGFFSYEDFPAKSFSRDPLIKRTQRLIEPAVFNHARRLLSPETAPSFWYALTVRKFGAQLGKAITALNRDSEATGFPDYFDAQHFIWPSQELDKVVDNRFRNFGQHLPESMRRLRRDLMHGVFSADTHTARRHVMRMFARDYAWIFKLRLRFDATYAAHRLTHTPINELKHIQQTFSLTPVKLPYVKKLSTLAEDRLSRLDRRLGYTRDSAPDTVVYQMMQVAVHIDYKGFRTHYLEESAGKLESLLQDSRHAADLGLLLELLHRVRIYHILIKMQILDYWTIVQKIGQLN